MPEDLVKLLGKPQNQPANSVDLKSLLGDPENISFIPAEENSTQKLSDQKIDFDVNAYNESFNMTNDVIRGDLGIEHKAFATDHVVNNWNPVAKITPGEQAIPENIEAKKVKSVKGNVALEAGDEQYFNKQTGRKVSLIGDTFYEAPEYKPVYATDDGSVTERPSAIEYIAQTAAGNALVPKLAARLFGNSDEFDGYEVTYEDDPEGQYTEVQNLQKTLYELGEARDPSLAEDVGSFVVSMLIDAPLFGAFGKVGQIGYKGTTKALAATGRWVGSKLGKAGVNAAKAEAIANGSINKLGQMAFRSGSALGLYNAASDVERQLEEGKSLSEIEYKETLNSFGHGASLGAATAPIALMGNISTKAMTSMANKYLTGGARTISNAASIGVIGATSLGAEAGLFTYGGALLSGEEMPSINDYLKTVAEFGALKLTQGRIAPRFKPAMDAKDIQFADTELRQVGYKSKEGLLADMKDQEKFNSLMKNMDLPISTKKKVAAFNGLDMDFDVTPYKVETTDNFVTTYDKDGNKIETVLMDSAEKATEVATITAKAIEQREIFRQFNSLPPEEKANIPAELISKVQKISEKSVDEYTSEDWKAISDIGKRVNKQFTVADMTGNKELFKQDQENLDYLKSRNVEVPDGTTMPELEKMVTAERKKEKLELEQEQQKQQEALKQEEAEMQNVELDKIITEKQKELGIEETPDVVISGKTEDILTKIEKNEPVLNEDFEYASKELYDQYKQLEAMKKSDKRIYSREQIESMQEFIGEEITNLENYANQQKTEGKFISEIKAGEAAQGRKKEITDRLSEIEGRKTEIDKQLEGKEVKTKDKAALRNEFVRLSKEQSTLNNELERIPVTEKPKSVTKPKETVIKEPESVTKPKETVIKEPESVTKPKETVQSKTKEDAKRITPPVEKEGSREKLESGEKERLRVRDTEQSGKTKKAQEAEGKKEPDVEVIPKSDRKKKSDEAAAKLKIKEKAALDQMAEGFSELMDSIGAKKQATGEVNPDAVKAVKKIADALIQYGDVKLRQLSQALREYFTNVGYAPPGNVINEVVKTYEFEAEKKAPGERTKLRNQLKVTATTIREAQKKSNADLKGLTDEIREKIKEAYDNRFISSGEYRSVIRRIGEAKTPRAREKALEYVDQIVEGSAYRKQYMIAKRNIKKLQESNQKDASKFGQAEPMVRELTNIDPAQLTFEELHQFNMFVQRALSNKKVPNVKYIEAALSRFRDRQKDEVKISRINTPEQLREYISGIQEGLDNIGTVRDYMNLTRQISMARNKATKLLDEELISEAEWEAYNELLSKEIGKEGSFEKQLQEFKDDYANDLAARSRTKPIREAVNSLPDMHRKPLKDLLTSKADILKEFHISDLEAYDNAMNNLEMGILTPYVGVLRRKVETIQNRENAALPSLANISKSSIWRNLIKRNFTGVKVAGLQQTGKFFSKSLNKMFSSVPVKKINTGKNLTRLQQSTKAHRLDMLYGNMDQYKTIGSLYNDVSRGAQKESNAKAELQERRNKIAKAYLDKNHTIQDLEKLGNFLIERSWQFEPRFQDKKSPGSLLSASFSPEQTGKITDHERFYYDQKVWREQLAEAREKGLTTEKNGEEIIDAEKYEQYLRKDKKTAKLLDEIDQYFEDMKPITEWATIENGRTFMEKIKYFPFRGVENKREIDVNEVKQNVEGKFFQTKMQANSTHGRVGVVRRLENNPFKVMEDHTNEILRNYFVYPELRASVGALKEAGKIQAKANIEKFDDTREIEFLTNTLTADMVDRVARFYGSGRYAAHESKVFNKILKGGSKSLLASPAKPPAELTANYVRAGIAIGGIPVKTIAKSKADKDVYYAMLQENIGDKYYSRYSPEVGGQVFANKYLEKAEKLADWMIIISDKAVGKPLFVHEFDKSFKKLTGKEFDPKEYASNEDYYYENKDAIKKSTAWGVKRMEELFNDKSILTTPQLTRFFGGMLKAESQSNWTKIFNVLQSFNRNEVDQLIDASRRLRYGDANQAMMGLRDIIAVTSSNLLYNTLRRGTGVALALATSKLMGDEETEFERENREDLLTVEKLKTDFRRSIEGLTMGGSTTVYTYLGKWAMYVVENSGIANKSQLDEFYKILEDDLYARKVEGFGSLQSSARAISPLPSTVTADAFKGMDGVAAILKSLQIMVEGGSLTEKQRWEIFNLFNLGAKYGAVNPISPTLQKTIDRKIREAQKREKSKEKSQSDNLDYLDTR